MSFFEEFTPNAWVYKEKVITLHTEIIHRPNIIMLF